MTTDGAVTPGGASRISADLRGRLAAAGLDPDAVEAMIGRAVDEDLDGGVDVTTVATVPVGQRATLDLVARRPGVVAGIPVAAAVFSFVCGASADISVVIDDGAIVESGDVLVSVTGPTHLLLQAERPALNLLGHLSGIATLTRAWVDAVAGTGAAIRDTRKTTPGMRRLEKYAVRCGGGVNHRMSLSDAALVRTTTSWPRGCRRGVHGRARAVPRVPVEVEVDSLDQLDDVLAAGADLVLLDNFAVPDLAEAVRRNDGRALLEASGGLSLPIRGVAATGVDYLLSAPSPTRSRARHRGRSRPEA